MTTPETLESASAVEEVRATLVGGVLVACAVCLTGSVRHWPAPDGSYIPLHDRCAPRWVDESRDTVVTTRPRGRLTGAYARRAAARGEAVERAPRRVSRSLGSPYFKPGMPEGTPWALITETNNGRHLLLADDRERVETVMRHHRLLTERGETISLYNALRAVGGVMIDPTGAVVDQWGEPIDPDSEPRWRAMSRVQDWKPCIGCRAVLWPLRLVSADGRCRACVEVEEVDDPRAWPPEPSDPGIESYPPEYGGPKRKAQKRARDDHA